MKIISLWTNPFKYSCKKDISDFDFLKKIPIFFSLSNKQIEKILSIIHIRNYKDSEIIFRIEDPGVGLFIVRNGTVDIFNEYPDFTKKKITSLSSGDFFGEIALLNDSPRSATVISSGNSVLYGLFRPDLLGVIDSDPKLGSKLFFNVAQILAERLRLTNLTESAV